MVRMCVQEEQIGDEQLEYLNLRYVASETTSSCFRFEDNNGFSRDVGYTPIMLHQVNVLLKLKTIDFCFRLKFST